MSLTQAHVFYSGQVQGVGFRYTCRDLARRFAVSGFVRNLTDGRVELVAEGERAEVDAFLNEIRSSQLGAYIREARTDWHPASGLYKGFNIES